MIEQTAKVVAHLKDGFADQLAVIKAKHDNDIAELQNQIRELKLKSNRGARGPAGKPPEVHSWHIDKEKSRVTCFFVDGTSLPHLDLYPLFENYFHQTNE